MVILRLVGPRYCQAGRGIPIWLWRFWLEGNPKSNLFLFANVIQNPTLKVPETKSYAYLSAYAMKIMGNLPFHFFEAVITRVVTAMQGWAKWATGMIWFFRNRATRPCLEYCRQRTERMEKENHSNCGNRVRFVKCNGLDSSASYNSSLFICWLWCTLFDLHYSSGVWGAGSTER